MATEKALASLLALIPETNCPNQTPTELVRWRPQKIYIQQCKSCTRKLVLLAKDVHDENVMTRDGSDDLVIVDLGLFKQLSKPKKSVTEARKYRIKLLTKPKK